MEVIKSSCYCGRACIWKGAIGGFLGAENGLYFDLDGDYKGVYSTNIYPAVHLRLLRSVHFYNMENIANILQ